MDNYQNLVKRIIRTGNSRPDRTGTGTLSLFGEHLEFDLAEGFPLVTTKKVNYKTAFTEMLWIVSGSTSTNDLDASIWDSWADHNGSLGRTYGYQMRRWNSQVDQLALVIADLQASPWSRRHIITLWNPSDLPYTPLPPCPTLLQFYQADETRLDLQVYQRSADVFLGVPFDIAGYGLLLTMVSHVVGLTPGRLVFAYGDVHLYNNHREQAELLLSRQPRPAPRLDLVHPLRSGIDSFRLENFRISGYRPHPAIPAPIAV